MPLQNLGDLRRSTEPQATAVTESEISQRLPAY